MKIKCWLLLTTLNHIWISTSKNIFLLFYKSSQKIIFKWGFLKMYIIPSRHEIFKIQFLFIQREDIFKKILYALLTKFNIVSMYMHKMSILQWFFLYFRFDFEHNQDEQVHLECFCVIASGIKVSLVWNWKTWDFFLWKILCVFV